MSEIKVEAGQKWRLPGGEEREVMYVGQKRAFLRWAVPTGGIVETSIALTDFQHYTLVHPPVFEGVVELAEIVFADGGGARCFCLIGDIERFHVSYLTGRTVKVQEVTG